MNRILLPIASFLWVSWSSIAQDAVKLDAVGPKSAPAAVPELKPGSVENRIVYKEPGRYGGWPANQGL